MQAVRNQMTCAGGEIKQSEWCTMQIKAWY